MKKQDCSWNKQILHAPTRDPKPFWNDLEATHTAQSSFCGAHFFTLDTEILFFSASNAIPSGLWVELGVGAGRSIRFLAKQFPLRSIYGFDSFLGLPEDWVRENHIIPKGTYVQNHLPEVPSNVHLIQGLFQETLPSFAAKQTQSISFLHVDCDLYSSTQEALKILKHLIVPETIILFDEFYNYPGYQNHEIKAFHEFIAQQNLSYHVLAFNALHEQVAIKITKQ